MSSQSQYRLGDLVTLKRGYDLPHASRTPGDFPIVSSSGITGTHKEPMAKGPGVVTGRYGTLGEVFFIPGGYWPLNTSLYVRDFKGNDPRFVAYYLRTVLSATFNSAGAVPGVNRNVLHKLAVPSPPSARETQRKIAAILTTYDDLIETNKRRIILLEKMAEEIYREWFVRTRFPGHQNAKFVKGVPEGWGETQFGRIARFTMGQSPKSEFYNELGDGLPFHQGVGTYGDRFPHTMTFCSVAGRRAAKGDILFSVRAPVGRLNIADCDMIIGRGLAAIRHIDDKNSYLYYLMKTVFSSEDLIGNGAIFNSVGKDELSRFALHGHPEDLIQGFEDVARPIDNQIEDLIRATATLTQTRDLLLPRLISGRLSVDNLDIQFPPSMQEEATGPTHA